MHRSGVEVLDLLTVVADSGQLHNRSGFLHELDRVLRVTLLHLHEDSSRTGCVGRSDGHLLLRRTLVRDDLRAGLAVELIGIFIYILAEGLKLHRVVAFYQIDAVELGAGGGGHHELQFISPLVAILGRHGQTHDAFVIRIPFDSHLLTCLCLVVGHIRHIDATRIEGEGVVRHLRREIRQRSYNALHRIVHIDHLQRRVTR